MRATVYWVRPAKTAMRPMKLLNDSSFYGARGYQSRRRACVRGERGEGRGVEVGCVEVGGVEGYNGDDDEVGDDLAALLQIRLHCDLRA